MPDIDIDRAPSRETAIPPVAPSSVDALARRTGLPAETLASLSEADRAGLASLETAVARAATQGQLSPETLQAVLGARDAVLDHVELADATARIDPARARALPPDATVEIHAGTITVSSNIYLYGAGATQAVADTYERQIRDDWGDNPATGQPWTYTDRATGKAYTVRFDVDVQLYDPANPQATPGLTSGRFNPFNRDNFIEVTPERSTSFVRGGDEGRWRAVGLDGAPLEQDNPASHEFGHLLGLPDRYTRGSGANPGWEGNVMAMRAGHGVVQQRDIDAVVGPIVREYERAGAPQDRPFRTEINP